MPYLDSFLQQLSLDPDFLRNVTTWQRLPARPARYAPFPADLDARLAGALRQRGIEQLYSHQAAAWQAARLGQHFVVVTPTASGKTLCYNLPIVQALLTDPQAKALYLFPTKALAQDQLAALKALEKQIANHGSRITDYELRITDHALRPAAYDGDTPPRERGRIRQQSRIILTNPDMLHSGILPHHPRWAEFFANLRFVVVDELHAYRGVFGSHVANVLRRLRRIARFHSPGFQPQFFCASATIANPQQLAQQLVEAPVTLIDDDGAPKGERHVIFYNPPVIDRELGLRRSSMLEAELLAGRLIAANVQTVLFARSRLTMEVLLTYLRERATKADPRQGPGQIRGYRGGYLPGERRQIEQGLRAGEVRAVVATNALELGVNIGGLDAAVLAGFPGTIASTWQQAGRAGRRAGVSLAILIASAGPLDQYIINHPDYFFGRSPEHALINPDNLVILSNHLACAVFELPFRAGEAFGGVDFTAEILAYLAESGEVQQHEGDWFWMGETYPAQAISLRTASPDNVVIQAIGSSPKHRVVIGELEREAAPRLLYEGAVYWHEGESYLVERLDWEEGLAWVRPAAVDYYTQASLDQQIHVLSVSEQQDQGGVIKAHGQVQVVSRAVGYRKIKLHTHETLGYGEIDLPEQVLETTAYWLAFGEELLEPLRQARQWRSDPNDYGPNWQQQRQAARARDGFRCILCGQPEGPGRQHDVHHKIPFRSFGYLPGQNENYRQANALDNLMTLCRSCHRRVEQGQRLRTGLGGLAYLLGNIAPLHLMCDPGDIGVIGEAARQKPAITGQRKVAPGNGQGLALPAGALPTITIYEKAPAGIGFSQRLYDLHEDLLLAAAGVVARCPCPNGCPACVGPLPEEAETDIDPKGLTLALLNACLLEGGGAAA